MDRARSEHDDHDVVGDSRPDSFARHHLGGEAFGDGLDVSAVRGRGGDPWGRGRSDDADENPWGSYPESDPNPEDRRGIPMRPPRSARDEQDAEPVEQDAEPVDPAEPVTETPAAADGDASPEAAVEEPSREAESEPVHQVPPPVSARDDDAEVDDDLVGLARLGERAIPERNGTPAEEWPAVDLPSAPTPAWIPQPEQVMEPTARPEPAVDEAPAFEREPEIVEQPVRSVPEPEPQSEQLPEPVPVQSRPTSPLPGPTPPVRPAGPADAPLPPLSSAGGSGGTPASGGTGGGGRGRPPTQMSSAGGAPPPPPPPPEPPPGLFEQVGKTKGAATGLVRAHIDLAKAEFSEILDEVKRLAMVVGVAIGLLLFVGMLIPVGLTLFFGEWLFGSMGWGILHGTEFAIAVIAALALRYLGLSARAMLGALVVAAIVGILFGLLFGLNLSNELWRRIGESVFPGLAPETRPLVVGTAVVAWIVGILAFVLGLRGGIGGAIGGLVVGAIIGALLGAFSAITFGPQVGAALGVAIALLLWPVLMAALLARRGINGEELKSRFYPDVTIETTKETIEWVRKRTPLGPKS